MPKKPIEKIDVTKEPVKPPEEPEVILALDEKNDEDLKIIALGNDLMQSQQMMIYWSDTFQRVKKEFWGKIEKIYPAMKADGIPASYDHKKHTLTRWKPDP